MTAVKTHREIERLIRLAKSGDAPATANLFESYRGLLVTEAERAVNADVRRRFDPGDIVQETYMAATRGLESFQGTTAGEFSGWLVQILRHEVITALRYHSAQVRDLRREREQQVADGSIVVSWFEPAANDCTPSQFFIRGEQAIKLLQAMGKLPDDQRLAVRMRYLEGEPLAVVAERMERSPDAVVGLIRRGLATLRRQLGAHVFA